MPRKLIGVHTRDDSAQHQYRQRVPTDILKIATGRSIVLVLPACANQSELPITIKFTDALKFSLRTADASCARVRHVSIQAQLERIYDGIRRGETRLSHKQTVALAGEVYRLIVDRFDEDPGLPEAWAAWKAFNRAAIEGRLASVPSIGPGMHPDHERPAADETFGPDLTAGIDALPAGVHDALEQRFGRLVTYVLCLHGMDVDQESRYGLVRQVAEAVQDAAWRMKRAAQGDYRPDPKAERFPKIRKDRPREATAGSTITGAFDDWWREAKATGRKDATRESYGNTVRMLVAFLKHDDLTRVSADDIVRFKDHRLASINPRTGKAISAKTVKDSDLAALKTIFGWCVANRRLESNPATGLTIKLGKKAVTRSKGFTDEEASALLKAADARTRGGEHPKTFAAKRWVPWLCAYTGARVGEVAQLRKQDVRQVGGAWVLRITPEAGTVKTNEARDVVLHLHLVEKGFIDFVEGSADGHLFVVPARDGSVEGPLKGLTNRLAGIARDVVTDPAVMPNHGWRHRFKTKAREAGLDPRVVDAIQGHAARTAGEDYGDVTVGAIARAITAYPKEGG